jgi:cytochrome c biogenesis protein CcmG/thiol:disulfide interchange protein DsbE
MLLLAPLAAAAAAGGGFWLMLEKMKVGKFDPRGVPSQLIGKPLPEFALPGQPPHEGFSASDLRAAGGPVLLNFFASWCVPCVEEAPVLMALRNEGVPVWGIAYKDREDATSGFLRRYGDPFVRVARDEPGTVAIDFGVYGVPESYLVDSRGVVRWRLAGGLTDDIVRAELMPLLRAARG